MPTRIIRDGILTSERVNALSNNAELFYRRLMSVADDHGRYSANLTQLRAYCYPLKLDSVKEDSISKHLAECVVAKLIVLYTVEAKPYLQMVDFGQRINGKSKYPAPDDGIPGDSRGFPGDSRLDVDVDVVVGVGVTDQKQHQKQKLRPQAALPDPPSWINADAWAGFLENRKAIKFPLTPRAAALVIRELGKLRATGADPDAILDQSTRNGWRDVFPIRQEKSYANGHAVNHKPSAVERVRAAALAGELRDRAQRHDDADALDSDGRVLRS